MTTRDPFSTGIQRLLASSGLGFVLFIILSIVFQGGEAPDYDAAATEYVQYAEDNQDDIQLSSVFMCFACFQFLLWAGCLRSAFGRAEEAARGFTRLAHIVFAGAILAPVGFVLSSVLTVAAVSQPEGTSPDIVRSLYQLSILPFAVAAVGLATMLYTSAFLILRLGNVPKWLGVVAMIGGLAFLVTFFAHLKPEDEGGAFGIFYPIGFLTLLIFVITTSIVMMREAGRGDQAAEPATPAAAG